MAEFTPTPEQRAAITSIDESVCVRAGAGTGKTAVLVGRYLELLRRKSVPVTCITAMTYTEKAAREMKDRIRRECAAQERRETNPQKKAWWRRQRIDLETADISTIHGFCAGILREHPVEAGIDPHFAVLDEVELGLLTEQCVADAIEARLDAEDEPALELLKEFGRDGVHDILKGLMLNRAAAEEALSQIESNTDEEFLSRVRTLLSGEQAESLRRMLDVIEREGLLVRIAGAESSDPTDKLEVRRSRTLHILRELVATDDPQQRMERVRELPDALTRASASGSRKNWPANDLRRGRAWAPGPRSGRGGHEIACVRTRPGFALSRRGDALRGAKGRRGLPGFRRPVASRAEAAR